MKVATLEHQLHLTLINISCLLLMLLLEELTHTKFEHYLKLQNQLIVQG